MKVPERRKYGMSNRSVFESEKEKAEDFQPTVKKWCTKPSAPKATPTRTLVSVQRPRRFFDMGEFEDYSLITFQ